VRSKSGEGGASNASVRWGSSSPRFCKALLLPLLVAIGAAGCAAKKPPSRPPPAPPYVHTATLGVTAGIGVVASVRMPTGFVPNPAYSPLWLQDGAEIGVVGEIDGKTVLIGFSGPNLVQHRIIAQDSGAPEGKIVDVAASPGGGELAISISRPADNRLDLTLRDLAAADAVGPGAVIAAVDGVFDFAQLTWLDRATLALAIRSAAPALDQVAAPGVEAGSAAASPATSPAVSNDGLYLIALDGRTPPKRLDHIRCLLSPLSFSPDRHFAVAGGDGAASPILIYVRDQACRALGLSDPIKVLGWAPNSGAFLYTARAGEGLSGVFRYDLTASQSTPIAVSSAAAAYTSDGAIIALGNRELTWRHAVAAPGARVKAEIARFDPYQPRQEVNSLGFQTPPAFLARSTMVYSTASDKGVIETVIPAEEGPRRELIEYSYLGRSAFNLAGGAARGPLMMSWSPNGRLLAIVDGDVDLTMLTVLIPP
jgi:hypothetical protein